MIPYRILTFVNRPHIGNRRAPSVLAETLKISDLQDSDGQSIFPSNADKTLQKVEDYNFAADPAEFIVYQIKDGWEVNDGVVAAYAMTKTNGEVMPETVKDLQAVCSALHVRGMLC